MTMLIFPDHRSRRAAERQARSADSIVVDTVLREADLRVLARPNFTSVELHSLHEQSGALTACLGQALPAVLRERQSPDRPALWECYGEYFRSWATAPLLANVIIAQRTVQEHQAQDVLVIEDPTSAGWWTFRQQVLEAVRAGVAESGVRVTASPGLALRLLRSCVAACAGAWAAGALQMLGSARLLRRLRQTASLPPPRPSDVLFLAIGSTSVPIIDRLAPPLRDEHGLTSAAIMFHPEDIGMERLGRSGVPYQYIDNFHAARLGRPSPLKHPWQVFFGWPRWFAHACRHAPRAELGALWPGLRNRLMIGLARDSQQMLADMTAATRILDAYRPRAVVALHLYWHRIAPVVLAARARGIPVLYLQHGVYLVKDDCIRPLPYDLYMVFGQAAAEALQPRVAAPILQVGHCLYDEVVARGRAPGEVATRLKDHDRALVLVATQPDELTLYDPSAERWWLRGVAEACARLAAKLVIKLHPRDIEIGMYQRLAQQMPDTVSLLPHDAYDLAALLGAADVLVTRDSTVVFQANLLGVPAITVNLTGHRDRFPFAADGGALGVYTYEDIGPTLARVLSTGAPELAASRARFLAKHTGPSDGRATERIAAAIAQHAKKDTNTR